MFGYAGRILRVNLTDDKIRIESPDENFYRRYMGGWGFIAYYLLRELESGAEPLSPANKLIVALGPITGVPIAGNGRNAVGGKSPLTGGFGASEGGGFFGAELKKAGFDCIIIEGRAEKPVYLWIHDGEAEIRDAKHIWGMYIADSQRIIREELKDNLIRTMQIGPGGENLVRYACVINDLKHAAGRTGMGAVMGSKRLKAIAVRGHGEVKVADPDKVVITYPRRHPRSLDTEKYPINRWAMEDLENMYIYLLSDLNVLNSKPDFQSGLSITTRAANKMLNFENVGSWIGNLHMAIQVIRNKGHLEKDFEVKTNHQHESTINFEVQCAKIDQLYRYYMIPLSNIIKLAVEHPEKYLMDDWTKGKSKQEIEQIIYRIEEMNNRYLEEKRKEKISS